MLGSARTDAAANGRWLILLVLFIARAAIALQFQSIPALSPLLVDTLRIDYALLGTLVGLYMLPGVIFSLPGGVLGQRFGDKQIAVLGRSLMVLWRALGQPERDLPLGLFGADCQRGRCRPPQHRARQDAHRLVR